MLIFTSKEKCRSKLPLKYKKLYQVSFSCILIRRTLIVEDKTIVCADCGNEFTFTVGEQEFYAEKGFDNEPKRCPDCRRARKDNRRRDY
jgi:hypothetical protein